MSFADRVTAFALFLGRNIDWLAAGVVVLAYFALDQGWIVLSAETIASALAFMAALRGYVELHNRGNKTPGGNTAACLVLLLAVLPLVGCAALQSATSQLEQLADPAAAIGQLEDEVTGYEKQALALCSTAHGDSQEYLECADAAQDAAREARDALARAKASAHAVEALLAALADAKEALEGGPK